MRRYFTAALLATLSSAAYATVGLLSFAAPVPTATCTTNGSDGFAGAPVATIQFPNLLATYSQANRPTWCVAGRDYATGYPAATSLKLAASGTLPQVGGVDCVTRNAGSHIFTVTANDCVLDAWDFSSNGGWQVTTNNTAMRVTISNSLFIVGANGLMPIDLQGFVSTGADATILNNVVNCGGNTSGSALDTCVRISRFGTHAVRYNYIFNANSDFLHLGADTVAGGHTTTYDIRFNLLVDAGRSTDVGAHADWMQTFASGNYGDMQVNYNTIWQSSVNAGGVQGILLQGNTNTPLAQFIGGSCSNNTFVTAIGGGAGGMNLGIVYSLSQTNGTWLIQNNFADPSAVSPTTDFIRADTPAPPGPFSGAATVTGNINMTNGGTLTMLLKRDLDPASNDNTPMWLNKVA